MNHQPQHILTWLASAITVLGLAACSTPNVVQAPGPAAQATGLKPQQERITETGALADRQSLEAVQQRLRKLNESGVPQKNYALAKAQCWLDSAKTQYHENDRTGYIEESLAESLKIVQALEGNKSAKAGYETPMVARSHKLRDDLWTEFAKLRNNETIHACSARTIACGEIDLVRAGHAHEQTGWRSATPYIMKAEDALRRATQEAHACSAGGSARAAAPEQARPAVTAATPALPLGSRETYVLLSDTLFKFNKSGREEMLPGGKERLAQVAKRLNAYQSVATLTVVGHTDRLGSDSYNQALSVRRAETVKGYLESLGVKAVKSEAQGQGKREPVTSACQGKIPRQQLIGCMQADRRVIIEVSGMIK